MSHPTFTSALPVAIRLGPPWPHRLASSLRSMRDRIVQAWMRRAQERAECRWAAAERASLAALDAHTLRDLGLGDWAGANTQHDVSLWRAMETWRF